jgi:hypothetical protein
MTRERLDGEQADAERHGTQCMWFPRGSDAANWHSAKLGSKRAAERQNNSIRRFAACFSANVERPSLTKVDNSNDTVNGELGAVHTQISRSRRSASASAKARAARAPATRSARANWYPSTGVDSVTLSDTNRRAGSCASVSKQT